MPSDLVRHYALSVEASREWTSQRMSEAFSAKLELALKALSMSRARLAADLGVDKSVVGRWVSGAVQPSAHNLSLLSALIAERIAGFTALDWDRSLPSFAELIGADLETVSGRSAADAMLGLPLVGMDQFISATALRGEAYEGFWRSTRPYVLAPGRFVHDHAMVRLDRQRLCCACGSAPAARSSTAGSCRSRDQLYTMAVDVISGAVLFGMFMASATARAEVVDGLMLGPSLDVGRTPTALRHRLRPHRRPRPAMLKADDMRFIELAGSGSGCAGGLDLGRTAQRTCPATSAPAAAPWAATSCCACRWISPCRGTRLPGNPQSQTEPALRVAATPRRLAASRDEATSDATYSTGFSSMVMCEQPSKTSSLEPLIT